MAGDMVERVARAIWDANGWHPPDSDDKASRPWKLCVSQARAAIAAMREPPDAINRINGSVNWTKMIDAALSD